MDRCPHCNKRMKTVLGANGRTEFQCLDCEKVGSLQDRRCEWAESSLAQAKVA